MDGIQGLVLVGRFDGDHPKVYGPKHPSKAGQPVPGMRELRVTEVRGDGGEFTHRLGYFASERDGFPTLFARALERFEGELGDSVAVSVRTSLSGKYVNLDPVGIATLAEPGVNAA